MNTTVPQAQALAEELLSGGIEAVPGVEKVLCPPFVSLHSLRQRLGDSPIRLGAQNMYFQEQGAFTGEVSPLMLSGLCQYVILGHSERRGYFGEGDELVNRKLKAALGHGLHPILCVGERLEEWEGGQTEAVVTRQVKGGLAGVTNAQGLVIAYEPVWAIGTGRAARREDATQVIGLIRETFRQLFGSEAASALRIQYGGSVTPANIAEFIQEPEIDGALVGGASLKAADFLSILQQTARLKAQR